MSKQTFREFMIGQCDWWIENMDRVGPIRRIERVIKDEMCGFKKLLQNPADGEMQVDDFRRKHWPELNTGE